MRRLYGETHQLLIAVLIACLALPAILGAVPLQQHPRPDEMQFLTVVRAFLDFRHDYMKFCDHNEAVAVMAAATMKALFNKKGMNDAENYCSSY